MIHAEALPKRGFKLWGGMGGSVEGMQEGGMKQCVKGGLNRA